MSVWNLSLQLRSWQAQKAIPAAGRGQAYIRQDAMLFCPLAMAGEDPSLHAVLLGERHGSGELLAAPDPRSMRHRMEMFSRLYRRMMEYFDQCAKQEAGFPQLILPSSSAADLVLALADYLPYLPDPKEGGSQLKGWVEDARSLGAILQLYAARWDIQGQQLMLQASDILDRHWAFGQEMRGHLGSQLIWIDPPADQSVFAASAAAEDQPMGSKTDAGMDRKQLAPALEAWAKVERQSSRSLSSFRRQEIEDALRSVLEPIRFATQQAIDAYQALDLEPLSCLPILAEREHEAFVYHMQHIADGGRFARKDSPLRAVYSLAEREDAIEQWNQSLIWDDPLLRAKACLEGEVLAGVAHQLGNSLLAVVSQQRWLRIRKGDEVYLMASSSQLKAIVQDMVRSGTDTKVLLKLGAGEVPSEGQATHWAQGRPDWRRLASERGKIARQLKEMPVTHAAEEEDQTAVSLGAIEGDPLAAVEELR